VRDGASITSTARRHAISRTALHRWLRAYDPDHPVASLRPKKTGPKAPRWTDEVLAQVVALIADHPDWWGKHRVATALRACGVILSEATVSRMLVVARQQLARDRDREARAEQVSRNRQVRTAMRRNKREAARAALWHERLAPAREPDLTTQELWRRIAQALASKRYKIQVKDLTPDLRAIADEYIENLGWRDILLPGETWLLDARKWLLRSKNLIPGNALRAGPNIDDLRAGALNHLKKNFHGNIGLGASRALFDSPETEKRRFLQAPQAPDTAC
jgi:hypothetical protein